MTTTPTPDPTDTATLRVGAVIPAAGRARRFGSGENKIWAQIGDRTVLERTIAAFDSHPLIREIVLVGNADDLERLHEASSAFPKVTSIVEGGETRAES